MNKFRQFLNDLEIKKAHKLAKQSVEMHMVSPMLAEWDYKIQDIETGKLEGKGRQLSHSYTRNMHNYFCLNGLGQAHNINVVGTLYGEGSLRLKFINETLMGSQLDYAPTWGTAGSSSASGNVIQALTATFIPNDVGILIGSGSTAESLDDFEMDTQIINAEITIGHPVGGIITYDSDSKTWSKTFSRIFSNNTGASITIREIGMGAQMNATTQSTYVLILRDVLPTAVVLADQKAVTFTYKFSYVMPT